MTQIEIRNVYKVFGRNPQAALELLHQGRGKSEVLSRTGCTVGLHDVSLSIGEGRIFVIMGLSGSGKSTLVRHVNRLIEPTAGEILYEGRNIMELNRRALRDFRSRHVSMVFQSFGLLPHRTVLQNVGYGPQVRGVPKAEIRDLAMRWIETVGLAGYENKRPSSLSAA